MPHRAAQDFWELLVLPYPPAQQEAVVSLKVRLATPEQSVVFGVPCQGIAADGTMFPITLLDSMFISGGENLYTPGTFEALLAGISLADAAKLVRIVHYPAQPA